MIASEQKEALGTLIEIKLPEEEANLFSLCFEELRRIEKTYSRFLDNSLLSKINNALDTWHSVPDEFISLLEKAEFFREKTDGNFDITLKAVLDQLGYDKNYSFTPKKLPKKTILSTLKESITKPILIDKKNKKIKLRKEIDFGGMGKGYALDRVSSLLEKNDIAHYYINAGGDIYAKKSKKEEPWHILLEHPDDLERAIGSLELDGQALAASSSNRRKWKGLHHLINAKSKKPAHSVKAIFVLAKFGIEADAYATALFTAGFEQAIALAKELPIEMLIISRESKMFRTKKFPVQLFQ